MIEWTTPADPECRAAYYHGIALYEREKTYLKSLYRNLNVHSFIELYKAKKDDGWYYIIDIIETIGDPTLNTFFWERTNAIRCTNIEELIICFAAYNPNCVDCIYEHNEDFVIGYLSVIKDLRPIRESDYFYLKGKLGEFLKAKRYDRRTLIMENTYSERFLNFVKENID